MRLGVVGVRVGEGILDRWSGWTRLELLLAWTGTRSRDSPPSRGSVVP